MKNSSLIVFTLNTQRNDMLTMLGYIIVFKFISPFYFDFLNATTRKLKLTWFILYFSLTVLG